MSVGFRCANEKDLQQIFQIEQDVMPNPWTLKSFEAAYSSDSSLIIVADDDNRICGFSIVYITAPESELPDIVVRKECQGQGIGRALLTHTVEQLRLKEVDTVFLEVRASNERAKALYESFGFEKIGTRKYFYSNPVEDAICMRKDI